MNSGDIYLCIVNFYENFWSKILTLSIFETHISTQFLTSTIHYLIIASVQPTSYRVPLTDAMAILRHTIVASNFLSYFTDFVQNIIAIAMRTITVKYSKTHFTNFTQCNKHSSFHSLPTILQSVKPSNSLQTFRTTALYRLQYHNNVTVCLVLTVRYTTGCQYAQYTVITHSMDSLFNSYSHKLQPSTPHCIRMIFLCFQTKCLTILHNFLQHILKHRTADCYEKVTQWVFTCAVTV